MFCYKKNTQENSVTVYSDIIRGIFFVASLCLLPFGVFIIPYFALHTKVIALALYSLFLYFFLKEHWHIFVQRIPLFIVSNDGIKPILDENGDLDFDAPIIKWEDIAEIFVYKAPYKYETEHTQDAGFRYLGIKLRKQHDAGSGRVNYSNVIPTVQVMVPYLNDKDIPLTMAHPFQRGLISWLNHYAPERS